MKSKMEEIREILEYEIAYFYNVNYKKGYIGKSRNAILRVDSNNYVHSFNDEPAWINYNDDGMIITKYWYKHGREHRLSGPAFIGYDNDGEIVSKKYYIEGTELTKEEFETQTNRYKLLNEL